MIENNITRCEICNYSLIYEEVRDHKCFKVKHIWVFEGTVWLGDGTRFYKWKSPDPKHPFKNTRRFNGTKNLCCDLKIY